MIRRLISLCSLVVIPLSISAGDQTGAELTKMPVSATIVGETKEWPGVGNVQVVYQDGSKDLWTTKKNCAKPRVAGDGTVGWVLVADDPVDVAASYKLRPDRMLVLCHKGKIVARLKGEQPFIRDWWFTKGSEQVVIEGGFAHGASWYLLMEVAGGKKLGEARDDGSQPLPEWAKRKAGGES